MIKLIQSYLRFWSKIYLNRTKPEIIAITGSISKTSTKEAIFEVLKIQFGKNVRKSEGNLNNETGVPLAVLGYKKSPQYFFEWPLIAISFPLKSIFGKKYPILVLEMAADKPGDIKYLTSFIKPAIACITSIGPAHLEAFETIDKIVQEKTDLLKSLSSEEFAVLNIDDEHLRKASLGGHWQVLTYATEHNADISAKNITTEITDFIPITKFQVATENSKFRAITHTLGRTWNIYSSLAAVAIGKILEMSDEDIIKGLKNIYPEKHRMKVEKGQNGSVIIDDSYNANPLSMRAALDTLKILPNPVLPGRKIVVLGDMLEIGRLSIEAHQLLGAYAREISDKVIAVGDLAKRYNAHIHFEKPEEAAEYLLKEIAPNDIILIKASRAIGLDKIAEKLKVKNNI